MNSLSPYYRRLAIAFLAVVSLYDIVQVIALNLPDPSLGLMLRPTLLGPTTYPDFITPYAVVHAYFEGKQAVIYDHAKLAAFMQDFYGFYISSWFLYPPVWVLMLMPFGLLPVNLACALFMVATAAASAFESRRHLWSWLAVATSPAAVWLVLSGQNSFLYLALIYGGMRLLEKRPVAAGLLLGCLVYKPQVCLLVPLALLAARQWKALAWMIGTGTAIVLASVAVFGLDFWLQYIDMARHMSDPDMLDKWASRRPNFMVSVFVSGRILQLPNGAASALQLGATALAAGAVWFAFRRHPHDQHPSAARLAVLMAGTILASPYTVEYDLILLTPVILMLCRQGLAEGFHPLEPFVYAVLWVAPTMILYVGRAVPATPVFVLIFGILALARLRDERRGRLAQAVNP
jgi:alpha-1,2-mannosyltransferase